MKYIALIQGLILGLFLGATAAMLIYEKSNCPEKQYSLDYGCIKD